MRVCQLIPRIVPSSDGVFAGGGVVNVLRLARGLSTRGHETTIITGTSSEGMHTLEELSFPHAKIVPIRMASSATSSQYGVEFLARATLVTLREARSRCFDLVHGHSGYAPYALCTGLVGALLRRPSVHTLYCPVEYLLDGQRRVPALSKPVARVALSAVRKLAAVSRAVEQSLRSLQIPSEKIVQIPMAVDVVAFARSHLRSDVRDRLGIEPAENAVLFVGNLSKNKGIDFLLEAATLMMREVSDMKLILTLELEHKGFHERLEAVTKRIGELGIRDKVLRLGFVRDMPGLMAAADVVVLPFLTTSGIADHPMVALEAMAAHRPVIASRVGGVPEIVRDGDTGLLVPPGDSAKLAQALLALLRQPALRQELGARGGALVAQRFSIERVSALTEALYRELADANAAS